ncbi:MAG: Gfo/Idh/MocA family oxidoreductase [Gemmatimonadetes bacterium]|jgi:predicted dehydrogenase|nr:Gfo/Idh/MocA family oxidoreductase [Gemmatimonadota bacterium]MBT5060420.1 Gfo/Idh/MocA family oxidoreductase [Gemmatimonadota bacterium]MBT5143138.1 Gfo/Idh/MocA family oxidoreductase [Gemmatimonadota bacterium]MBT5588438.1 Gfo/Idh/MocA family oxidoreductase [Gemmatimonadota bacterium]MBT5964837.1 Gfo/Idh/MocA family oxidoreductase [Gemmatimonadota bacterium]
MGIGTAVVGVGYWGPNLVRNLASTEDCDLLMVCDRDAARRESVGRQHPGVQLTDSVDDVLSDSRVDAVVVSTPADTHYELALRVLESGRSVFVEKPLARTSKECERLIAEAEKRGVQLMVGHTFEFNAAVEYVENLIEARELGQVYYIYSQRLNLGVVRHDVNALWNLAPHDISIALRWLKRDPVRVAARGYTYLQAGVEDVVYVDLEFADGVAVHIHVSWLDPGKVRRMTVVGSRKMVVYDDASTEGKIQVFDKGIDREQLDDSLGEFDSFGKFQLTQRAGDVLIPKIDFVEPLKRECSHFVESVLSGKRPLTDGRNGLKVVRILEAATRSLQGGGVAIELDDLD